MPTFSICENDPILTACLVVVAGETPDTTCVTLFTIDGSGTATGNNSTHVHTHT